MRPSWPDYSPVKGKTYSLFSESDSTVQYYETIRLLADKILEMTPDIRMLVEKIELYSSKKTALGKILINKATMNLVSDIIKLIDPELRKYTENSEEHLCKIQVSKRLNRRIVTSREQYHLFMLEIELTNRMSGAGFTRADKRIALMPYCLQDFSVKCKSEKYGFDYQCKHCSPGCFQNHASKILKAHKIEPFIWTGGNMKQLAKYTLKEKKSFGVLGIACIPELTWGMRNCRKNNIPVVGIPLNANRCVRWFGDFFPNNIDLTELENLVTIQRQ
jgi:hypothetical protein